MSKTKMFIALTFLFRPYFPELCHQKRHFPDLPTPLRQDSAIVSGAAGVGHNAAGGLGYPLRLLDG